MNEQKSTQFKCCVFESQYCKTKNSEEMIGKINSFLTFLRIINTRIKICRIFFFNLFF